VTEITLAPGASLTHYNVQQENRASYHIAATFVDQGKDSHYCGQNFALGSKLARHDICTRLLAPGAHAQLYGLYMPRERQHHDQHTQIHHVVGETTSEEFYKGILQDKSQAVFNGKVIVAKQAQKISSVQTNHNLLLSPLAQVNTKPELQIYADDVQCAHGATVGQLDENALFYLRARGIALAQAKNILTQAFVAELLQKIDDKAIRHFIEQQIVAQLPYAQ